MPLQTATPDRIRRSIREAEYARVSDPAVLIARPAAQDGFANVREGFFDNVADAQILMDELAGELMQNRYREAIETDTPFRLGQDLPLTPEIPRVLAIDQSTGFAQLMFIKGVSIDLGSDRNSIEVIGTGEETADTLLGLDDGDGILLLDDDTDGTSGLILG
jgi:hypothetical protein